MAENEGLRTTGEAIVLSITPDVCKTPPSMAPVPYQLIGRFSDGICYADTIYMTKLNVMTMNSRLTTVYGDEAGTGGGVASGVNKGWCKPITHSLTVRAKGHYIIYHTALYSMNCSGPDGTGNTTGSVVYVETVNCVYIGPLGTIEGNPSAQPKPQTKEEESWWEKGLSWVHTGLDVVGLIPGLGEIADGANAVIHATEAAVYAATGNNTKALENSAMALLSVAAMWPAGGQAATAAKWGIKGGKEVVEAEVKHLVKEGIEEGSEKILKEGIEEGTERIFKEGAEEAAEKATKDGAEAEGSPHITAKISRKTRCSATMRLNAVMSLSNQSSRMVGIA